MKRQQNRLDYLAPDVQVIILAVEGGILTGSRTVDDGTSGEDDED